MDFAHSISGDGIFLQTPQMLRLKTHPSNRRQKEKINSKMCLNRKLLMLRYNNWLLHTKIIISSMISQQRQKIENNYNRNPKSCSKNVSARNNMNELFLWSKMINNKINRTYNETNTSRFYYFFCSHLLYLSSIKILQDVSKFNWSVGEHASKGDFFCGIFCSLMTTKRLRT